MFDSQEQATRLFECLIHPVKPVKFFKWVNTHNDTAHMTPVIITQVHDSYCHYTDSQYSCFYRAVISCMTFPVKTYIAPVVTKLSLLACFDITMMSNAAVCGHFLLQWIMGKEASVGEAAHAQLQWRLVQHSRARQSHAGGNVDWGHVCFVPFTVYDLCGYIIFKLQDFVLWDYVQITLKMHCWMLMCFQERLHFSENIDVVTYTDGKRETHNPGGRAFPSTVWDYYQVGGTFDPFG